MGELLRRRASRRRRCAASESGASSCSTAPLGTRRGRGRAGWTRRRGPRRRRARRRARGVEARSPDDDGGGAAQGRGSETPPRHEPAGGVGRVRRCEGYRILARHRDGDSRPRGRRTRTRSTPAEEPRSRSRSREASRRPSTPTTPSPTTYAMSSCASIARGAIWSSGATRSRIAVKSANAEGRSASATSVSEAKRASRTRARKERERELEREDRGAPGNPRGLRRRSGGLAVPCGEGWRAGPGVPGAAVVDFFRVAPSLPSRSFFRTRRGCVEPLAAAASRRPSLARQEASARRAERLFSFRVASYVTDGVVDALDAGSEPPNSSSTASALSPSAHRAGEAGARPALISRASPASSREYPPDSANTRRTPGYFSLAKSA